LNRGGHTFESTLTFLNLVLNQSCDSPVMVVNPLLQ